MFGISKAKNTNCFISKIIRMLLLTKKFPRILKNPREYSLFTPRDISRNISGGEMRNGCISRLYQKSNPKEFANLSKLFLGILNSQYILERDRVDITKKLSSEF